MEAVESGETGAKSFHKVLNGRGGIPNPGSGGWSRGRGSGYRGPSSQFRNRGRIVAVVAVVVALLTIVLD